MSNSKKRLLERTNKELQVLGISKEELLALRRELLLGLCPDLPDNLLKRYVAFTRDEGEVAVLVYMATRDFKEAIVRDVTEDHPHLTEGACRGLASARLKSLRDNERTRICNRLGIYVGKTRPWVDVNKMLSEIWKNYQGYRVKRKVMESVKNPVNYPYAKRNKVLKEMGYGSYQEYLQSDLWKEIRSKVLSRDNYICKVCGKGANQVHHRSYDQSILEGKFTTSMVSLCETCHTTLEFNPEGDKRDFSEVTKVCNSVLDVGGQSRRGHKKRKAGPRPKKADRRSLSAEEIMERHPLILPGRAKRISKLTPLAQERAMKRNAKNRRRKQAKRNKRLSESSE